ncbi:hypothetical protein [Hyphomicrobium sp. ghe19]|uniref:hypothetical protein n=1 Tax=Hyphomicrobium sp. ghe19 TaxID=2682968 RepID=UPI0013675616|nr:hypothetical protein HYPP_03774 [Hyphomicrobium sp. ghe19]
MSDANTKIYRKPGGNELVVAAGGKLTVEPGAQLKVGALDLSAIPKSDPADGKTIWLDNGVLKVAGSGG